MTSGSSDASGMESSLAVSWFRCCSRRARHGDVRWGFIGAEIRPAVEERRNIQLPLGGGLEVSAEMVKEESLLPMSGRGSELIYTLLRSHVRVQ